MANPFDNMSEVELDAALPALIEADKAATETRAKTNEEIAKISCNLMMAVGRKYQVNPTYKGEDIAIAYLGAEAVNKWKASTKAARFSEWDAVGEAARKVKARFNPTLWAAAGGKDKFRTVCRAIVRNPAATHDQLVEAAKAKPATQDGDHVEVALRALGKVSAANFPAILEAVKYLQEVRREEANFATTAERAKAAKASGGTVDATKPLTLADKIALAEKALAPTVN